MVLRNTPDRKQERGVTILIVAISLMAILAMSALAIDIVALYVSEGDAQRTADAAALAGAKTFVTSGFTSGQLGDPTSGGAQSLACNGSTGFADLEAQAVANRNPIAGVAATTVTTSCTWAASNPQITVSVQRTGLPSFFARIWGGGSATVTRTAKAEAYNPSGQAVPIQVHSVKPWLIPNGGFYFDTNHNIKSANGFIGQILPTAFILGDPGGGTAPAVPSTSNVQYYPASILISPPNPICPSTSAVSCSNLLTGGGHADYRQNIACSATQSFKCGDCIGPGPCPNGQLLGTVDTADPIAVIRNTTVQGTECLIHADGIGPGLGQDVINPALPGAPVTIDGGYNNPNAALTTATNITRSDSVVTVPVYEVVGGAATNTDLCPGGVCSATGQVVGFLQLGIQLINNTPAPSTNHAVILNAAGCNPANGATPAVSGGGVSPIPVRLIQ
jgi:Putative Flp pilus-assembly TadE/G-like